MKKTSKVYCHNCKYFCHITCAKILSEKKLDTPFKAETITQYAQCTQDNANNDCKYFEKNDVLSYICGFFGK